MKRIVLLLSIITIFQLQGAPVKIITLGTGAGNPSMTRDNSCTFLQTKKYSYLIDAGGPVTAKIIRKGLDFNTIKAVFITHMHQDHFGGLSSFLGNRMVPNGPYNREDRWLGFWPEVWMPDPAGITAFDQLMAVQFRGKQRDRVIYRLIKEGPFYDDGNMKATAIPNRHIKFEGGYLPSFCFLFEVEGKKILCTGDLAADFSDFPVEAAKDADIVMCESTHFNILDHIETFKKIRPKKLIFNHVGRLNEARYEEFQKQVDYPVVFAKDNDEFEF